MPRIHQNRQPGQLSPYDQMQRRIAEQQRQKPPRFIVTGGRLSDDQIQQLVAILEADPHEPVIPAIPDTLPILDRVNALVASGMDARTAKIQALKEYWATVEETL